MTNKFVQASTETKTRKSCVETLKFRPQGVFEAEFDCHIWNSPPELFDSLRKAKCRNTASKSSSGMINTSHQKSVRLMFMCAYVYVYAAISQALEVVAISQAFSLRIVFAPCPINTRRQYYEIEASVIMLN